MNFEFSLYNTIDECTDTFNVGDYVIFDYSFSESFHNKRNIKIIKVFENKDNNSNTLLVVKYENDDEYYLIPAFSANYIIKYEKKK